MARFEFTRSCADKGLALAANAWLVSRPRNLCAKGLELLQD